MIIEAVYATAFQHVLNICTLHCALLWSCQL